MSERVIIDPDICNGKPVVQGTRITVQTILEFLAAGDSVEDFLKDYPKLSRPDIEAGRGSGAGERLFLPMDRTGETL